ncbi:hypothetical protein [Microbispora sp. H10830]|uniref:hypothetical protein n=1 Tax=Microbispora sp. H10830 TaxID=2729109 RepID=UPI001601CE2D|nr:hypothetical protein [Microbispora sp. H10830]
MGSFRATVGDDRVTVPERIYNPEVSPEKLDGLTPLQQTILHCLYTRHHDGIVRQRHLTQIIGSLEPWALPYVVHLVGEYVLEIVADIGTPGSPTHQAYGRFLAGNRPVPHPHSAARGELLGLLPPQGFPSARRLRRTPARRRHARRRRLHHARPMSRPPEDGHRYVQRWGRHAANRFETSL